MNCDRDEFQCKSGVCKHYPSGCDDGPCIPKDWKNDGEEDCTDGSDENKKCEYHRSVQSQLQTESVQAIWHMPNYSLISWVPKTGKNKKFQRKVFSGGPIKGFSFIKLHATEVRSSLNEVCEGVAGVKNHTKKSCFP